MEKRGLPRKLYVDNGSAFRSHKLRYGCARLGVALLHATPYTPEGKGKIERFFGSLRKRFLPLLEEPVSLEKLNEQLASWIESDYHGRVHSSTGQTPLERYLAHLSLLRPAPRDLRDYFRTAVRRKVDKDRTVSLYGKIYEAPLGLIGKMVSLLFHEQDLSRIEVLFDEASQGFLLPLNAAINSRVRRTARQQTELTPEAPSATKPAYHGGSLFESGKSS